MTRDEAKQIALKVIELRAELAQEYDSSCPETITERKENLVRAIRLETELSQFIEKRGLPHHTWNDSVEALMACGFSENQSGFIRAAQQQDIVLSTYSSRGMFGEYCPATREEVQFDGNLYTDYLGRGFIFYARY
jgi:hypothetical protein